MLGEEYKLWSSSLCSFLHPPVTSNLFDPNILHNTLFSNTHSVCSSLNVIDQVSHPYRTSGILSPRKIQSYLKEFLKVETRSPSVKMKIQDSNMKANRIRFCVYCLMGRLLQAYILPCNKVLCTVGASGLRERERYGVSRTHKIVLVRQRINVP
jgi:hypothetical protein